MPSTSLSLYSISLLNYSYLDSKLPKLVSTFYLSSTLFSIFLFHSFYISNILPPTFSRLVYISVLSSKLTLLIPSSISSSTLSSVINPSPFSLILISRSDSESYFFDFLPIYLTISLLDYPLIDLLRVAKIISSS
jgi:hypothetical protein